MTLLPLSPLALQTTGHINCLEAVTADFGRGEEWKYSDIRAALAGLTGLTSEKSLTPWKILHAPFGAAHTEQSASPHASGILIDQNPERLKITVPAQQSGHVQLALLASPHSYLPGHVVIEVGEGASLTIFEYQAAHERNQQENQAKNAAYWKNMRMEIDLAPRASLNLDRQMADEAGSVSLCDTHIRMGQAAELYFTLTNTGRGFLRHQMSVDLLGPHSIADLAGINLLDRKSHGDVTVKINHMAPHCRSSQYFKTILRDQARGVYQGKIHVHQNAQKTDGYQLSNHLLLSPLAEMDVKPELEIYADDVKCSHGTTTGELDETPIFYMKSRGIDEMSARQLL
ncbi:MAG: SufD family Fe-S cluster assembly protein, partial [Alphaproteobacteria bacterium]|nr:SufD family Fe-S cluster assembly protein [Alphaproteobacteria bacterium]